MSRSNNRLFVLGLAFAAAAPELGGQKLYDALYKIGYHDNVNLTHAKPLVAMILRMKGEIGSVLDVGCSHGFAVQSLWHGGVSSNGVDVSGVAADLANRTRTCGRRCAYHPCLQQADAAQLPFERASFDAILSTDVLEHIQPGAVNSVCAEFARVTRRYLFLKIAYAKERVVTHINQLKKRGNVIHGGSLHASVMSRSHWIAAFSKAGFRIHNVAAAGLDACKGGGRGTPGRGRRQLTAWVLATLTRSGTRSNSGECPSTVLRNPSVHRELWPPVPSVLHPLVVRCVRCVRFRGRAAPDSGGVLCPWWSPARVHGVAPLAHRASSTGTPRVRQVAGATRATVPAPATRCMPTCAVSRRPLRYGNRPVASRLTRGTAVSVTQCRPSCSTTSAVQSWHKIGSSVSHKDRSCPAYPHCGR